MAPRTKHNAKIKTTNEAIHIHTHTHTRCETFGVEIAVYMLRVTAYTGATTFKVKYKVNTAVKNVNGFQQRVKLLWFHSTATDMCCRACGFA